MELVSLLRQITELTTQPTLVRLVACCKQLLISLVYPEAGGLWAQFTATISARCRTFATAAPGLMFGSSIIRFSRVQMETAFNSSLRQTILAPSMTRLSRRKTQDTRPLSRIIGVALFHSSSSMRQTVDPHIPSLLLLSKTSSRLAQFPCPFLSPMAEHRIPPLYL